jgi:hypothetical protein
MINPAAVLKALRAPKSDYLGAELSRVLHEINVGIRSSGTIRPLDQAEAATIKDSLSSLFCDISSSSYVVGKFTASIPPDLDPRETVEALKEIIDLRLSVLANAFTVLLDERLFVEVQLVRGTYDLAAHAKAYHDMYTARSPVASTLAAARGA